MIREEYNPDSGLFLYTITCDGDDCEARMPPRGSEGIAMVEATLAKWALRKRYQKMSGYVHYDYCPLCKKIVSTQGEVR